MILSKSGFQYFMKAGVIAPAFSFYQKIALRFRLV